MHYFPDALILTHVEFDHADIYRNLDAVKTAFRRLVNLVPRRGRVVAFDGSANVDECVARAFCSVERYGFKPGSHWRLRGSNAWRRQLALEDSPLRPGVAAGNVAACRESTMRSMRPRRRRSPRGRESSLPRSSRPLPPSAVSSAGLRCARSPAGSPSSTTSPTIQPRFARRLKALRAAYPGQRLWAVLEPRSNTLRRNVFERELVESLALADKVLSWRESSSRRAFLSRRECIPRRWLPHWRAPATMPLFIPRPTRSSQGLTPRLQPGDVVAILSNGGFDGIYEKLPQVI